MSTSTQRSMSPISNSAVCTPLWTSLILTSLFSAPFEISGYVSTSDWCKLCISSSHVSTTALELAISSIIKTRFFGVSGFNTVEHSIALLLPRYYQQVLFNIRSALEIISGHSIISSSISAIIALSTWNGSLMTRCTVPFFQWQYARIYSHEDPVRQARSVSTLLL